MTNRTTAIAEGASGIIPIGALVYGDASIVAHIPDADLPLAREMALEAKREQGAMFDKVVTACNAEMIRRMRERGAHAIPSPDFIVELKDEFSPYAFNVEKLKEAANLLPPDEAAKVVKFVPERTEVVPAHHEAGHPVSIAALAKKYAGTQVAELLNAGMTRAKLDDKLVCKARA